MARSERVQLTLDRLKVGIDTYAKQLSRENEDLAFQVPEKQWPSEIRERLQAKTVAGIPIPAQPMLSVSTMDEPIQLVENQFRAAHLGVTIVPLDADADDDTAEVIQGLYRHIETTSRANQARGWAYKRSLRAGRGCYEITKEYDPSSTVPGDQRLVLRRVLRQEGVVFDPFAELADADDREWTIKIADLSVAQFKRRFKGSKVAKYSDAQLQSLGNELANEGFAGWIGGDGPESRTIRVAQHFYYEYESETIEGETWRGERTSIPSESRQAYFCFTNGAEELGEPVKCDGETIPVVLVIAEELIPFDSERQWIGMTYRAKDGARLTNYAASNAVKMAALEPLAPYTADPRQIEGYETFWKQSNTVAFPYLPVNRIIDGQVVEPPQRTQADMSRLGPSMELLRMGKDFVQSATATFDPALGKQPTAHRSGRAIVALQDQTMLGTSNYLDNFAEVSMPYEASYIISAIPKVYDRPGRIQQILDPSGKTRYVMLNQPFVPHPQTGYPQPLPYETPEQQQLANSQVADPNHPAKHYDLQKGRYGVSISIGKSYANKQQEGATEMGEILQAAPQYMPVFGDLYFKYRGEPWAHEVSKRLGKMREHDMPWLSDSPAPPVDPRQLMAENEKLKQMVATAGQALKSKQVEKQTEMQGKFQIAAMQESAESQRAAADREVKLAVAELGAKVDRLALFMEERARVGLQAHEAMQNAADRSQESQLTAQSQAHDLGLAVQDHAHTLDQQSQAATLQPPSGNGNGGAAVDDGSGGSVS